MNHKAFIQLNIENKEFVNQQIRKFLNLNFQYSLLDWYECHLFYITYTKEYTIEKLNEYFDKEIVFPLLINYNVEYQEIRNKLDDFFFENFFKYFYKISYDSNSKYFDNINFNYCYQNNGLLEYIKNSNFYYTYLITLKIELYDFKFYKVLEIKMLKDNNLKILDREEYINFITKKYKLQNNENQ